jgi:hypothetical protein
MAVMEGLPRLSFSASNLPSANEPAAQQIDEHQNELSRDSRATTRGVWIGNRSRCTAHYYITAHTLASQSVSVFSNRSLIAASNGGRSPFPAAATSI